MDAKTTRRIGDASAVVVLTTMAMTWLVPKGIGMFVTDGFSGFDILSQFQSELILAPLAALICLGILIYSEVNPSEYEVNRKQLAVVRMACTIVGAYPGVKFVYDYLRYDPMEAGLFGALIPMDLGEGAWLHLIAFLVLGGEAIIDYLRPEESA